MSDDSRGFEDPKIALTFSLLKHMDYITAHLNALEEEDGADKETIRAALCMATLLRRVALDPNDKEMWELKKNITFQTYAHLKPNYVYSAYDVINEYMNQTYFADFHKAKPKVTKEGHI
jgi:hypothetical protein